MVEGQNAARGQWIGRTSQIKVLNFTAPEAIEPRIGQLCARAGDGNVSQQLLVGRWVV